MKIPARQRLTRMVRAMTFMDAGTKERSRVAESPHGLREDLRIFSSCGLMLAVRHPFEEAVGDQRCQAAGMKLGGIENDVEALCCVQRDADGGSEAIGLILGGLYGQGVVENDMAAACDGGHDLAEAATTGGWALPAGVSDSEKSALGGIGGDGVDDLRGERDPVSTRFLVELVEESGDSCGAADGAVARGVEKNEGSSGILLGKEPVVELC